jgi:hypothetical protein
MLSGHILSLFLSLSYFGFMHFFISEMHKDRALKMEAKREGRSSEMNRKKKTHT